MGYPNITVNCRVLDNQYDHLDRDTACVMINNILDAIKRGDYRQGQRNNMAVDLTCLCHVLEIDAEETAALAFDELGGNTYFDRIDLAERVETIKPYTYAWDAYGPDGVFDYLTMEWEWKGEPDKIWIKLYNNEND